MFKIHSFSTFHYIPTCILKPNTFSSFIAYSFINAKEGTIFKQVYDQKLNEHDSFSLKPGHEAIYDFLDRGENSAFYTSTDLIPDDVVCRVKYKRYKKLSKVSNINYDPDSHCQDSGSWNIWYCSEKELSIHTFLQSDFDENNLIWSNGQNESLL